MDEFLYILAQRKGYGGIDIQWNDVYTPGTEFTKDIPLLGIEVHYYEEEPIQAEGTIYKFTYSEYRSGIAFLGEIFVGTSISTVSFESKHIYLNLETPNQVFIMVPTRYRYLGDGFFIGYDVDTEFVDGCEYWVVTPISTPFVPYYIKIESDLGSAYTWIGEPSTFSDLVWSYSITQVYSGLVTNDNTVIYEPFFIDDNVHTSVSSSNVAGAVFSLSKAMIDTLISIVLRSHPLASLIYTIASSFFSYGEVNVKQTAIAIELALQRYSTLIQPIYVYVKKLTLIDRSAEPYTPLMSKYIVSVSPAS